MELNEAVFYLTTLLDKRFISCIQDISDRTSMIDFLSNLDKIESSMMALPYDLLSYVLNDKFNGYNTLFKNCILPLLHEMNIDFNTMDGLFN
jgi:hypothetical protein